MDATGTIRPPKALEVFAGLLVREIHDLLALLRLSCNSLVHTPIQRQVVCFVKCIIPQNLLPWSIRQSPQMHAASASPDDPPVAAPTMSSHPACDIPPSLPAAHPSLPAASPP